MSIRRMLAAVGCMAAGLFTAAAATAGTVDLPLQIGGAYGVQVRSLKEARFAATVRQQYDYSCGSAALATLLTHHYGHAVGEQSVFDEMFTRGEPDKIRREGFSLLDMKRYLAAHGFDADGFEEPLQRLAEAGIPAIALVNEGGYRHFVVIKGLQDGRVLVGDPSGGTRVVAQARFEASRANGILFVVGNRREAARFNAAADWAAMPRAPLAGRVDTSGSMALTLPKLGAADF